MLKGWSFEDLSFFIAFCKTEFAREKMNAQDAILDEITRKQLI
jgi:hypothetical protein